jgi:3-oxo-5-alpha-steroid 4-dehydrogenase 1
MEARTFEWITWGWIALAIVAHIALYFVVAPFGRHSSAKWGPSINNKAGWVIMELPSLAIMVYFLIYGSRSMQGYTWILFALWIAHYLNRTFIYPLRIRPTPKRMPLFIVGNAIFFNLMNAGLNGYYLAELAPAGSYATEWLMSWPFALGLPLFLTGVYINWRADGILISLRAKGETGYRIPRGFLFERITAPNLFGEIVEWTGFAVMAWNLPAFSFMVWTLANLVPRARDHHRWYQRTFPDYPKERKAVIPGLL